MVTLRLRYPQYCGNKKEFSDWLIYREHVRVVNTGALFTRPVFIGRVHGPCCEHGARVNWPLLVYLIISRNSRMLRVSWRPSVTHCDCIKTV